MKKKQSVNRVTIPPKKLERTIGLDIDGQNKQFRIYTNDILLNQIDREARKNSKTFDKLCRKDIESMSSVLSRCAMHQARKNLKALDENDDLSIDILSLLWNANTSFIAAVSLLRTGFRLQPGIICRNIVETISMAFYLYTHQDKLEAYRAGKIKSSNTISTIKKIIPPFGELYGFYSEEFAHIGDLQRKRQPIGEYQLGEDALTTNLSFLKTTSWILDIFTELLCFDVVDQKRYWQSVDENVDGKMELTYAPTEEVIQWISEYMGD